MSEDAVRQAEEWDALFAFYGDDKVKRHSACDWKINIIPHVNLYLKDIPADYPSSNPPKPFLVAPQWIMDEQRQKDLEKELLSLFETDVEVGILWAEHVRAEVEEYRNQNRKTNDKLSQEEPITTSSTTTRTFIPATSKHAQSMRTFEIAVVDNSKNYRELFRGDPFHPPKSGPSETMVAHAASVTCMDHVNWVLHHLLFMNKKIGQATHNMIAYRFKDSVTGCLVSDSDDDGEKGSGSKLAALLDLSDTEDCIVIVSRWYGGIHLGPARFKWIAAVARQALDDAGFLKCNKKKVDDHGKKRRGRK